MSMREIREGIGSIYTTERMIPRPYNVYPHGVLRDIKNRMLKNFWRKKK